MYMLCTKEDSDIFLFQHRFLIYHLGLPLAKGLISARESLDVVTIGETEKFFFISGEK